MKRIILTESQYKRLVRQNLNEQRVVYVDPKDEKDINYDMFSILDSVAYNLDSVFNKNLYVKKIEGGKVYIDKTKYTQEEIDYIRKKFKILVNMNLSNVDKMFTNDSDLGFDSGVDSDYDWGDEDITVIDDEGTAEVEDNDDVADVVDISYCDYGLNSKGEKRNFVPPPNMDIKFYQDILKSIGANVTCQKMLFFYAWRTGENSKSTYNPFATTEPNEVNEGCYYNCLKSGEGYKPVGCRECPSGTSPGVRNYKTYESGLKNTVKTLTNGRYNNVVTKLKNDNITAEEIASEKSELKTWGTGGLVLDILKYYKKIKPTPISKYGDEPKYVLPDDEEILDIDETNLIKPSSNYGDSRDYGWRDPIPSLCNEGKTMYCTKHWHGGEDYPYPTGTEIYVFQPGEVIEKGDWTLKIKHDDGSKTRYVHCDEFFVEKGDRIESGTLIGTVGNKGPTTGSHLHFEYWKPNENKTSNPKDIEDNYIRFKL